MLKLQSSKKSVAFLCIVRSSGFHNRELKVIIGYRMKHPVFATAACPATVLALALIELPLHGVTVHTVLN